MPMNDFNVLLKNILMSYLKTIYSKPDQIRPWEVGIGRGMKEGGDVMFYFISFDYFQYFRDQIPKGGFQD